MRTCDCIAEFLLRRGIGDFFGFQGGSVTPLIDAMVSRGLKYHQCLHEQASGFAAEAWARITGKTGVVVVTNGPGVTNLVSSIANAYLDSTPCVFLLGQVNVRDMKKGMARQNGFQEIDSMGMVAPVCKSVESMKSANEIYPALNRAFASAESGRRGSACLEIPMDVLLDDVAFTCDVALPRRGEAVDMQMVSQAAEILCAAERPVILAGGGVRASDATAELDSFAKSSGIPIVKTLMGLDSYSGESAGFSGVYGQVFANRAIFESDVLLVLGARFAKRQIGKSLEAYAPNAKIIHVDIAPEELGTLPDFDLQIKTDVKDFLVALSDKFRPRDCSAWSERIACWKVDYADAICCNSGLDPVRAVRALSAVAPDDIAVVFDVGQNEMWCAQGWTVKSGQRILASGGLGCMGFSLPAAVGAAIAGKKVWAFTGDGGLQMNIQELQTVVSGNLPVKVFVFNNRSLGMIQEGQLKYHAGRYFGTRLGYSVPDIKRLSEAYGLPYVKYSPGISGEIVRMEGPAIVEIEVTQSPSRVLTRYDNPEDYV